MANDFAEFVALLVKLATFLLDMTVNLICLVCLVAAMLLPWRLLAVLYGVLAIGETSLSDQHEYRRFCMNQVLCSLEDLVTVPMFLASLLWPLRWPRLLKSCVNSLTKEPSCDERRLNYSRALRACWFKDFWLCIWDVPGLFLAIIALFCPWRTVSVLEYAPFSKFCSCRNVCTALREPLLNQGQSHRQCSTFDEALNQMVGCGYVQGFLALLEAPFVAFAIPSVLVPTRTVAFFKVICLTDRGEICCDTLLFCVCTPVFALADICCAVLFPLALLNPLRSCRFLGRFNSARRHEPSAHEKLWHWHFAIRAEIGIYGLLTLLDLLLLPAACCVALCPHRSWPMLRELCPSPHAEQPDDRLPSPVHRVVLQQFGFICLDLVTLPCLLMVLATCYRWPQVLKVIKGEPLPPRDHLQTQNGETLGGDIQRVAIQTEGNEGSEGSEGQDVMQDLQVPSAPVAEYRPFPGLPFHKAVAYNCIIVLHDLLFLPFGLGLLLTMYRVPTCLEAIRSSAEGNFRKVLWGQVAQLLLDLPVLPVLLILLITVWRADYVLAIVRETKDAARRRAVLEELLRLLRDAACLLAALLVAGTLVRLPSLLLELWSQHRQAQRRASAEPRAPRFRIQQATLVVPAASAADRRPCLAVEAVQDEEIHDVHSIGKLQLEMSSVAFWKEVSDVFGGAIASLGQGLLPMNIVDGKHVPYGDLLSRSVRFEVRLGSSTLLQKLPRLNAGLAFCMDIERFPTTGAPELFLRFVLPLEVVRQATQNRGAVIEFPKHLFDDDAAERVCGTLVNAAAGLRDIFWVVALKQLILLLMDCSHLALLLFCLLAPWRFLGFFGHIRAADDAWIAFLATRAVALATQRKTALASYRSGLEPALNAASKNSSVAGALRGMGPAETVLQRLGEQALPPRSLERWLLAELQHSRVKAAQDLGARLVAQSALQEAAATYWSSMSFAANLECSKGRLSPEEHACALGLIEAAQSSADLLAEASLEALGRDADALCAATAAPQGLCSGLLTKPLEMQHELVRYSAASAVMDWVAAGLLLLLLLSVYRLPRAWAEFHSGDTKRGFADRLRMATAHQAWLLARDLGHFLSAMLASFLAIVTLVRAIDFLSEALLHTSSLIELRDLGFRCSWEALAELWELISLFTLWRTYRCIVKASVFGLLLPAYGFRGLPSQIRLLLWLGLCCLVYFTPGIELAMGISFAVLMLFFPLMLRGPVRQHKEARSGCVRPTWPNLLALLGLFSEALLLVTAPGLGASLEGRSWGLAAGALAAAWLLLTAVPPSLPVKEGRDCHDSARFQACYHGFRQCLLLPVATVLLTLAAEGHRWAAVLLLFLTASSVLGITDHDSSFEPPEQLQSQPQLEQIVGATSGIIIQDPETRASEMVPVQALGLDLASPPLYMAGLALCQLPFLALEICLAPRLYQVLIAVPGPLWAMGYPLVFGSFGPVWLPILREVLSLIPLWAQLCRLGSEEQDLLPEALQIASDARWYWWAGCGALLIVYAVRVFIACRLDLQRRHRAAAASGISHVFRSLACKNSLLCRAGNQTSFVVALRQAAAAVDAGSAPPAQSLAQLMEDFEAFVRVERLNQTFLKNRSDWLQGVRSGCGGYGALAVAGRELLRAVITPPVAELVVSALKASGRAASRVPRALWAEIIGFVGGAQPLTALLEPGLTHYSRGGPAQQLQQAQSHLHVCTDSLYKLKLCGEIAAKARAEANASEATGSDAAAVVDLLGGVPKRDVDVEIEQWWAIAAQSYGARVQSRWMPMQPQRQGLRRAVVYEISSSDRRSPVRAADEQPHEARGITLQKAKDALGLRG